MINFGEVLHQCYMMDLSFQGPFLKWNNKQRSSGNIQERLNIFIANFSWKSLFQDSQVTHLNYFGSDHRILKLDLSPLATAESVQKSCNHAFCFEPFWRTNENFKDILAEIWNSYGHTTTNSADTFMEVLSQYDNS